MNKINRPDIDEYFLKIASVVAERATCQRHHIGAVAVEIDVFWQQDIMVHRPVFKIVLNWVVSETK